MGQNKRNDESVRLESLRRAQSGTHRVVAGRVASRRDSERVRTVALATARGSGRAPDSGPTAPPALLAEQAKRDEHSRDLLRRAHGG
jgi:hypothetical protein